MKGHEDLIVHNYKATSPRMYILNISLGFARL